MSSAPQVPQVGQRALQLANGHVDTVDALAAKTAQMRERLAVERATGLVFRGDRLMDQTRLLRTDNITKAVALGIAVGDAAIREVLTGQGGLLGPKPTTGEVQGDDGGRG